MDKVHCGVSWCGRASVFEQSDAFFVAAVDREVQWCLVLVVADVRGGKNFGKKCGILDFFGNGWRGKFSEFLSEKIFFLNKTHKITQTKRMKPWLLKKKR